MNRIFALFLALLVTGTTQAATPVYKSDSYTLRQMTDIELNEHLETLNAKQAELLSSRKEEAPQSAIPDWKGPTQVIQSMSLAEMWVLGEKIYDVIKKNEPVMNIQTDTWSVLPTGIRSPFELNSWKKSGLTGWVITYTNLYGFDVVDVAFVTSFAYGGQKEDKGAFLANVAMIPTNVDVAWGYTVNMTTEAMEAINVGTKESPIAGLGYSAELKVETIFKKSLLTFAFNVNGKGEIQVVPVQKD